MSGSTIDPLPGDSANGCAVPVKTKEQNDDTAATILKAMGAQACVTDAESDTASATMNVDGPLGLSASAAINAAHASTKTCGCNQLAVAVQKYNQTVNNITCLINSSSSSSSLSVSNINTINIHATGYSEITCGVLTTNQEIKVKIVDVSQITTDVKEKIKTQVDTFVKQTATALLDSKNGFGSTPQGQSVANQIKTNIDSTNFQNTVNTTLSKITKAVENSNTIDITATDHSTIKNTQCTITQNILVDMVSRAIIGNALSTAIDETVMNQIDQATKAQAKSDNQGQPNALNFGTTTGKIFWTVIIIVVLCIVGYLVWSFFLKPKGPSTGSQGASSSGSTPASKYYYF